MFKNKFNYLQNQFFIYTVSLIYISVSFAKLIKQPQQQPYENNSDARNGINGLWTYENKNCTTKIIESVPTVFHISHHFSRMQDLLVFEMRQEVCHILLPQTILVIFKSNLGEFN